VEAALVVGLPMKEWLCDAPARPGNTIGSSFKAWFTLQLACISWYAANGGWSAAWAVPRPPNTPMDVASTATASGARKATTGLEKRARGSTNLMLI